MPALSQQQLNDFRADIGDENGAFSPTELQRLWERTEAAGDFDKQWQAMMALAFMQLLNNATRLHDYNAGATAEKMAQVYDHLKDRYEDLRPALDAIQGTKAGMRKLTLRASATERSEPHEGRRRTDA